MTSRRAVLLFAAAFAALAGCSVGPQSTFMRPTDTSSLRLVHTAVKEAVLHSFMGGATDGSTPISSLVKVGDLFYGITGGGGSHGKGTVFSISPAGTGFTVLYSFNGKQPNCPGSAPAGLTNVNGTLYGVTQYCGTKGEGTAFSITTAGALTTLYSFKGGSDGAEPMAQLTNVGGMLYGTTAFGGRNSNYTSPGTVFSINTSGQEKILYRFGSTTDDGLIPESRLVLLKGKLYGTTISGGIGSVIGNGTIFRVTTGGKETVLYRFRGDFKKNDTGSCSHNCYLTSLDGTLYGTAYLGGKKHLGSVFSITPGGVFKTLYSASRKGNVGGNPSAALTNVGGTLYGTMSAGPVGKNGTVFSIAPGAALNLIYTFSGGKDGATPMSSLSSAGGTLYGTTAKGGTKDAGTIYSISGF